MANGPKDVLALVAIVAAVVVGCLALIYLIKLINWLTGWAIFVA